MIGKKVAHVLAACCLLQVLNNKKYSWLAYARACKTELYEVRLKWMTLACTCWLTCSLAWLVLLAVGYYLLYIHRLVCMARCAVSLPFLPTHSIPLSVLVFQSVASSFFVLVPRLTALRLCVRAHWTHTIRFFILPAKITTRLINTIRLFACYCIALLAT